MSNFWECAKCGQQNPVIIHECSCAKPKAKRAITMATEVNNRATATPKQFKVFMLLGGIAMTVGATLVLLECTQSPRSNLTFQGPLGVLIFAMGFGTWLVGRLCQWWTSE
jgi:hypothetical protein